MKTPVSGKVYFDVYGKNISRFVSRCISLGIDLKNVQYGSKRNVPSITICVYSCDVKKVCKLAKECKLRMRTVKRRGMLFFIRQNKTRWVLMFGWIIVVVALFTLSKMTFFIEINGCYKTEPKQIENMLKSVGIKRFSFIKEKDIEAKANSITSSNTDISSTSITIKGVKVIVDIQETVNSNIVENDNSFRNLYAAKSGLIINIATYTGKPMVRVGDIVSQGDMLISGDVSTEEKEILVHARGKVTAQVAYSFVGTAGPTINDMVRSGEYTKATLIEIFDKKILSTKYKNYEIEYIGRNRRCNCIIPIKYKNVRIYELKKGKRSASEKELYTLAESQAYAKMNAELDKSAKIISKKTVSDTDENGAVKVIISIITEEDIVLY